MSLSTLWGTTFGGLQKIGKALMDEFKATVEKAK